MISGNRYSSFKGSFILPRNKLNPFSRMGNIDGERTNIFTETGVSNGVANSLLPSNGLANMFFESIAFREDSFTSVTLGINF